MAPNPGPFGYDERRAAAKAVQRAAALRLGLTVQALAQPPPPMTAAALAKQIDLERRGRQDRLRSHVRSSVRKATPFDSEPQFRLAWRGDGRKLLKAPPETAIASGNRIVSMEAVQQMAQQMRCDGCRRLGTLVASAAHEVRHGLYSSVGLFCRGACRRVTATVPLTRLMDAGRKGFGLAELNVRANIGAAQAGSDAW